MHVPHCVRRVCVLSRRTTRRIIPTRMRYDMAQEDVLSEIVNVSGDDNTAQLIAVILMRQLLSPWDAREVDRVVAEVLVRVVASWMVHVCVSVVRDFLHVTSTLDPPHVL